MWKKDELVGIAGVDRRLCEAPKHVQELVASIVQLGEEKIDNSPRKD